MPTSLIHTASSPIITVRSSKSSSSRRRFMSSGRSRIAVVGDVHGFWNLEEDTKALRFLQPDLVLFTGDFGEEDVELVRSVPHLEFAKAVILGNHDAWHTQQFSGKKKDRVQLQLDCLGPEHVGYKHLDFPSLKLSVVGGRPFSRGGAHIYRKKLLAARFGVEDMDESVKRICRAAQGAPDDHFLIFLAHNGPLGLGSEPNDICGVDWNQFGGGDHGDSDLALALSQLKGTTKLRIPLVVFGHMHKELAYRRGFRKMVVVGADNTVYLNGAVVPRVRELATPEAGGTSRAFTVVEMMNGRVERIAETWVSVVGEETALQEEHILFQKGEGSTSRF